MEFSIDSFIKDLFEMLLDSQQFPFMYDEKLDSAKHPKRTPLHLKSAIRQSTTFISGGENIRSFDIGNESLERSHPYYHILENSYAIRKKNRGTKKTKGSQASIEDVGKRDYERVNWNGKTFTKEYSRNVRGSRNRKDKLSHWENIGGKREFVNREANSYLNTHYHYIENALNEDVVDLIAAKYNLKRKKRIEDTGLGEEYETQRLFDMFDSHIIR